MNQILQSDWFRERAEFSDLDRGQRYGPNLVLYSFIQDNMIINDC